MSGWWDTVLATLGEELADTPEPEMVARVIVRVGTAAALGALLGWEREMAGKAAGVRTHMLVAMGAALFVLAAEQAGIEPADTSRVLQGIVSGIGFLGAGTILKRDHADAVHGLTTAAGIWFTAAIGTAAGMGHEGLAILSGVLGLLVLWGIPLLQNQTGAHQGRRDASDASDPAAPPPSSGDRP